MSLLKIKCPECNAGLKSASGFTVGKTVCCPKCETYFEVEAPEEEEEAEEAPKPKEKPKSKAAAPAKKPVKAAVADDKDDDDDEDDEEEEEKPKKKKKKKKKKRGDDGEGSYKKSPVRFIILGILLIVMLVLGYFLYKKRQEDAINTAAVSTPSLTAAIVRPVQHRDLDCRPLTKCRLRRRAGLRFRWRLVEVLYFDCLVGIYFQCGCSRERRHWLRCCRQNRRERQNYVRLFRHHHDGNTFRSGDYGDNRLDLYQFGNDRFAQLSTSRRPAPATRGCRRRS